MKHPLLRLFFFLIPYLLNAQNLVIVDVDTSSYPIMKARFVLTDSSGTLIQNPVKRDFILTINGEQREIKDITCPGEIISSPISLAVSIDISGSMAHDQNAAFIPVELGKKTAVSLIRNLISFPSEAALQVCNESAYICRDFTSDKQTLIDIINNNIEPGGGNNFLIHLLHQRAGLLPVAAFGRNKKVALLITDAWYTPPFTQEELNQAISLCKEKNITFYAILYSREESEPNGIKQSLREIASATGGRMYDDILTDTMAEELAQEISSYIRYEDFCEISWETKKKCINIIDDLQLHYQPFSIIEDYKYFPPISSIMQLKIEPDGINFGKVALGKSTDTTVYLTAVNANFLVKNVTSTNLAFSSPFLSPFVLKEGESAKLRVVFSHQDTSFQFGHLDISSDKCHAQLTLRESPLTMKVTYPNGGEIFLAGDTARITWQGTLPREVVRLEFSTDNGTTWQSITDSASGTSYKWHNIPRIVSDRCIVRASATDSTEIWNTAATLRGHNISTVSFSKEGDLVNIASATDSTLTMWSVDTWQRKGTLSGYLYTQDSIVYSSDRRLQAHLLNDSTVQVLKIGMGQQVVQDVSDSLWSIIAPEIHAVDVQFSSVVVNTSKDTLVSTFITNTGSVQLQIEDIHISGTHAKDFVLVSGQPPYTIASGTSRAVEFRFTPSATGRRSAKLEILAGGVTTTQTINGIGITPRLVSTPQFVDFGVLKLSNNSSKDTTIILVNKGITPLVISHIQMLYSNDFIVLNTTNLTNRTIQPGKSEKLTLRFHPTDQGRSNALLKVYVQDMEAPLDINLLGQTNRGNTVMITGVIVDSEGKPITCKIVYQNVEREADQGEVSTDRGRYRLIVSSDSEYVFYPALPEYIVPSKTSKRTDETYREEDFRLLTIPEIMKTDSTIVLNSIVFDFDKADLRPASVIELNRLGTVLQKYGDLPIEIAGHTDDVGDADYNLELSNRRAKAVRDYLAKKISPNKFNDLKSLISVGYGESKPKVPNDSEKNRQINRRVEFKFR